MRRNKTKISARLEKMIENAYHKGLSAKQIADRVNHSATAMKEGQTFTPQSIGAKIKYIR